MTDIYPKEKRSAIMRKIGPIDSTQEIYIRKIAYSMGYRFRLHRKELPGNPDVVFPKYKKVIFIHGCFWHGHKNCKRAPIPRSNRVFWKRKITNNFLRDEINYRKLSKLGWKHLTIWQCTIKKKNEILLKKKIKSFLDN